MNEIFPLERASEAYDRMMSGKARFRSCSIDRELRPARDLIASFPQPYNLRNSRASRTSSG